MSFVRGEWSDLPDDGPVDERGCSHCGERSNCTCDDCCPRRAGVDELLDELWRDELEV